MATKQETTEKKQAEKQAVETHKTGEFKGLPKHKGSVFAS